MTIYEKKLTDESFKKFQGRHFEESWYTHIITGSGNGWYLENGIRKILFKFRKNVISSKYSDIAIDSFLELSKKKHSNKHVRKTIYSMKKKTKQKLQYKGEI